MRLIYCIQNFLSMAPTELPPEGRMGWDIFLVVTVLERENEGIYNSN